MNSFSIFAFLLCVTICYSAPEPPKEPTYNTRFDNVDLNAILKNKRLVSAYVQCVCKNVGCTAEGNMLREYLPDALRTSCAKCSVRQRQGAVQVFSRLEKDYPDELEKVLKTYDPDHKFYDAFKKANPAQ